MAFRKQRQNAPSQPTQLQFPTNSHLKTTISARFPDGSKFDFFVIPEWVPHPGLPAIGEVIQFLPRPGLKNVVLQNAAHDYLRFAFGLQDGLRTDDGEHEMPLIGMLESDQQVADEHGIDLFDWTINQCQWSPNISRDPRTGERRIRDEFGLEEKVLASVHGVLRSGLRQSTFHLSESALYVFGESHGRTKTRMPLELLCTARLAQTVGDFQAIFFDPGDFDFGDLPEENLTRGSWDQFNTGSIDVLVVSGFQVADRNKWRDFLKVLNAAVRNVLPTKRATVNTQGRSVEIDFTKTIVDGWAMHNILNTDLSADAVKELVQSDEYQRAMNETLAALGQVSFTMDLPKLSEEKSLPAGNAAPASDEPNDLVQRLARVDEMHREGVISDAEHREHRKRLLGEI